jgi:hypothetical protein
LSGADFHKEAEGIVDASFFILSHGGS